MTTNLDKTYFSRAELIQFVEKFATEHDFAIDPISFVQSFVSKGILKFNDDVLSIPLPFIETYLLASELARNPDKASQYFTFDIDDFDSATFDIYAELGASPEIVERFLSELERSLAGLAWSSTAAANHVLLSEKLNPAGLGHPDKMRLMQKRLRRAAKDVIEGSGDTRQKQKLLDLADRVRDKASRKTDNKKSQGESEKPDALVQATGLWYMGVILLGSGAEHLSAEKKRRLARLLLDVASAVTHGWTVRQKKVNFEEIKNDLTSEENLSKFEKEVLDDSAGGAKPARSELKTLVETMIDLLEFAAVSTPFKRILSVLCEQAHHKVLAVSLDNVSVEGPIGELIRSTWLLDVDRTRGREPFKSISKGLPYAPLLRINLATHLIFRAYWSHSELEDRRKLLDAAEQALSPLSVKVNKEKVLREIELTVDSKSDAKE